MATKTIRSAIAVCKCMCWLCSMLIATGGLPVLAQESISPETAISAAEVLYLEGDYESAQAELSNLTAGQRLTGPLRARALELLVFCHDALGDAATTQKYLLELYQLDTAYVLREWANEALRQEAAKIQAAVKAKLGSQPPVTVRPVQSAATSDPSPTQNEKAGGTKSKGKSKRLFFVAAGAAVLAGLAVLAGGKSASDPGDGGGTLDTLPLPPGRPAGP